MFQRKKMPSYGVLTILKQTLSLPAKIQNLYSLPVNTGSFPSAAIYFKQIFRSST